MMAKRVSGRATVVLAANTRMWVVRASSRPPPNAGAARADIVGMGSWEIEVRVPRSVVRKFAVLYARQHQAVTTGRETYSSCVKVARSFRSAPAQKLVSTSLANMSARVAPVSPSLWILLTWCVNSASSWRDMAFRAAGRLNDNMRILPE